MSNYIVGLTGGIGSGKTTVANLFATLGIELVDADVIARDMVAPGTSALKSIVSQFGGDILFNTGELNRRKLRQRVFNDPQARCWLNNVLHPIIRTQLFEQAKAANSSYVIMVAPLLFENELDSLVNRTLLVDISPELQISRTTTRDNVDAEQVANIINSQMSRELKLNKADDVIDNQGQINGLNEQVKLLHKKYLTFTKKFEPMKDD